MTRQDRGERRSIVVSFRVTAREAAHIAAAGAALNHPRQRADFARAAALSVARQKAPPPARPIRCPARRKPTADVEALTRILGQLGRIGGNLNQLVHLAHRGALPGETPLRAIADELHAIRHSVAEAIGESRA